MSRASFWRKAAAVVFLLALMCALMVGALVSWRQEYIASAIIAYGDADESGWPLLNGERLNPQDILHPMVIAAALEALHSDEYTEALRSRCQVEPMIPSEELTRRNAILAKGEVYDYIPHQYRVSVAADDAETAGRALSAVLDSYFLWLESRYGTLSSAAILLPESEDYGVRLSMLNMHIASMTDLLQEQYEASPDYRSMRTGYTYEELLTEYQLLDAYGIMPLASATDISGDDGEAALTAVLARSQTLAALSGDTLSEDKAVQASRAARIISSIAVETRYHPVVYAALAALLVLLCGGFLIAVIDRLRTVGAGCQKK